MSTLCAAKEGRPNHRPTEGATAAPRHCEVGLRLRLQRDPEGYGWRQLVGPLPLPNEARKAADVMSSVSTLASHLIKAWAKPGPHVIWVITDEENWAVMSKRERHW